MAKFELPGGMVRSGIVTGTHHGYMPGFGNDFETEALPGALPQGIDRRVFSCQPVDLIGNCTTHSQRQPKSITARADSRGHKSRTWNRLSWDARGMQPVRGKASHGTAFRAVA